MCSRPHAHTCGHQKLWRDLASNPALSTMQSSVVFGERIEVRRAICISMILQTAHLACSHRGFNRLGFKTIITKHINKSYQIISYYGLKPEAIKAAVRADKLRGLYISRAPHVTHPSSSPPRDMKNPTHPTTLPVVHPWPCGHSRLVLAPMASVGLVLLLASSTSTTPHPPPALPLSLARSSGPCSRPRSQPRSRPRSARPRSRAIGRRPRSS